MAASRKKIIKQRETPSIGIRVAEDPDKFYGSHPSWSFSSCDVDSSIQWAFCQERLADRFWDKIFPKLREFEKMTWGQILLEGKKQNHSIVPEKLNKCARDRLIELRVEAEAIYSLRLGGTLRLYGYMNGATYSILWYDEDHGDNDTCVCRSFLKHT